ncbi:hypothetical protein [Schleiferilactobacillus harbinensis]|uniref:Uncharacterized protein n=1 Tax=Schleiferilactobacillus harbinensis TaxID=304207 RepID=A0A5P8M428_9LACO|nr:hypothetical protein [Schleiferilactobacillus harbinensis]QFR23025.1 hypothetical protein D1010_05975 [Schleiferilactobacillus harbinensis]
MADNELKKVYRTYQTIRPDGTYFALMYWPPDVEVVHPYTTDPIPDELKAKLPFYDWSQLKWIDGSADTLKLQLSQLAAGLKSTGQTAATANTTATDAKTAAEGASSQAEQLQAALLEISDLVLSSTIAKDDTNPVEGGTK